MKGLKEVGSKVHCADHLSDSAASTTETPGTLPSRFPKFHASEQGPWSAMVCYEACVRLCLHSLAKDSDSEASSYFLENDCVLIRNAFG